MYSVNSAMFTLLLPPDFQFVGAHLDNSRQHSQMYFKYLQLFEQHTFQNFFAL